METTKIARTSLVASKIGLGTWAIGGWMWGGTDEAEAIRTIQSAVERGITLIDTAPAYGFGRSEEIVGKALAEGGLRSRAILATKMGLSWRDGRPYRDASPERIQAELEASLARLRTDVIDIYQVHWPDPLVPIDETAAALGELHRRGRIRAIGVSNFNVKQLDAFARIAPIHCVQPPWNLFERDVERYVLPWAEKHGVTVLAYGALCRGLLSGRMTPTSTFDGDDLRNADPKFKEPRYGQYLAAVDKLATLARERYGRSVLALSVRWLIERKNVVALWGARRPEQLGAVDDVFGWSLDEDTRKDIDRILAETITDPVGPEFMAPPTRKDLPA